MVRTCVFCGAGDLSELDEGLTYHGFPLVTEHGSEPEFHTLKERLIVL